MIRRLRIWRHRWRQVPLRHLGRYCWQTLRRQSSTLHAPVAAMVRGRHGLEIGGPSAIFRHGLLPIYGLVEAIDNCQFSGRTRWQGEVREGPVTWAARGRQYIIEGTAVDGRLGPYDFVAASHVLEHIANPLKALHSWSGALRPEGGLILVVPHKAGMFDWRRPDTPFAHLREDLERDVGEEDPSHIGEVLALHEAVLDPGWQSPEEMERSVRDNRHTRRLHHHVFGVECLVQMMTFLNLAIVGLEIRLPHHTILVARKRGEARADEVRAINQRQLQPDAPWRSTYPFVRS